MMDLKPFFVVLAAWWLYAASPALASDDKNAEAVAAYEAYSAENYAEAERLARALAQAPGRDRAAPDRRLYARMLLTGALLAQDRCAEAGEIAATETRNAPSASQFWALLFEAGYRCRDYGRAAEGLAGIARTAPESIAAYTDRSVLTAARWSSDPTLLAYLVDGAWRPQELRTDLSNLRLSLAAALAARNELPQAREAAQRLVLNTQTDMTSLVLLFADRRFERIIAADPETFNFDTIIAWQLQNARTMAASDSSNAMAQQALAEILYDHGRYDESLALIESVLARAESFSDIAQARAWLLDTRAKVLEAQGDIDAGLEALRTAAGNDEQEQPNVSQRLNYASMLLDHDRPQEALAQLQDFNPENASGYGRLVMLRVLVCAHAALGDEANMRARLNLALETGSTSLRQIYAMALCANDLNLAARTLLAQLDHPTERETVILAQQTYLQDAAPESEIARLHKARDAQVRARRDVARALAVATTPRAFAIRKP